MSVLCEYTFINTKRPHVDCFSWKSASCQPAGRRSSSLEEQLKRPKINNLINWLFAGNAERAETHEITSFYRPCEYNLRKRSGLDGEEGELIFCLKSEDYLCAHSGPSPRLITQPLIKPKRQDQKSSD